jgi:Holliday junction resolvase RusA-like endonuclease
LELIKDNPLSVITFTFPGHPIAAVRMTQASMWRPASQNYIAYRNALADNLRAKYPSWQVGEPPPASLKKERAAWNKEQKRFFYRLGVDVYLQSDRGDWDNYYKAAADSIQCAGLIYNDRLIEECTGGVRRIDKDNPRMVIVLEKVLR